MKDYEQGNTVTQEFTGCKGGFHFSAQVTYSFEVEEDHGTDADGNRRTPVTWWEIESIDEIEVSGRAIEDCATPEKIKEIQKFILDNAEYIP